MIQADIDFNKSTVLLIRNNMVDNGYNMQVPDPFSADSEDVAIDCRISNEKTQVEKAQGSNTGMVIGYQKYILTNHETVINDDEEFSHNGKYWRISSVQELRKFGGVVGYRAQIFEAGEVPLVEET